MGGGTRREGSGWRPGERLDGLLVDGLLAAGYVVDALNPKVAERYRERTRLSGGKTDPADVGSARPDPGRGP